MDPKYLTGLKPVNDEFNYITGEEGEFFVDHANGYDRVNEVIEALTNTINTYNTTRDDIRGMIQAYVLEEEVSLNQLLDYLTGGMGEALQAVSNNTKDILNLLIEKLEVAEKTNEELVEEQTEATNAIENGEAEKTSDGAMNSGEEAPKETPADSTDSNIDQPTAQNQLEGADDVHTKKQATDEFKSQVGIETGGHQSYTIVPDGSDNTAPGVITQSEYETIIAQVAGEGGNSVGDMYGVASSIFNRRDTGGGYGNSFTNVLETGYWPWGKTCNAYLPGGKYYNTDWGQEKLAVAKQVVDQAMNGYRNIPSNGYYYSGDGTHNYFSDVL